MGIVSISVEECKEFLREKKDVILLDVRTQNEHSMNKIPSSILIPLNELQNHISELSKDDKILIYCATGNRSQIACNILQSFGFENCFNVDGGIDAWQKAGFETEKNEENNILTNLLGF